MAGRKFNSADLLDSKEQIMQNLINRGKKMFPKLWGAQGRKCSRCGKELSLGKACKSAYSFEIVCSKCYAEDGKSIVIDEII